MSETANVYASSSDISAIGRQLTAPQEEAAQRLLKIASAKLRLAAKDQGKNLDTMIAEDADYGMVVRGIIVQAVCRALDSIADSSPAITQGSQSALGYSASMTYLNAGQSLYFLRNELKELGLRRQRFGALEVYACADDD